MGTKTVSHDLNGVSTLVIAGWEGPHYLMPQMAGEAHVTIGIPECEEETWTFPVQENGVLRCFSDRPDQRRGPEAMVIRLPVLRLREISVLFEYSGVLVPYTPWDYRSIWAGCRLAELELSLTEASQVRLGILEAIRAARPGSTGMLSDGSPGADDATWHAIACLIGERKKSADTERRERARDLLTMAMDANPFGAPDVRSFLAALLDHVWRTDTAWRHALYRPMIAAGVIEGELEADGAVVWADWRPADEVVLEAIAMMGEQRREAESRPGREAAT